MPYADVNGQRLYYEDTGGTGPAIVFSHGLAVGRDDVRAAGGGDAQQISVHRLG